MRKALAALAIALTMNTAAHAFCGFYVSGSDKKMFNDATNVVLVRNGTRTVLSMQNDYRGPLEDFAMVIPVPVVLKPTDVKVIPKPVFDRIDSLGSPRLVEYWEEDPCPPEIDHRRQRELEKRSRNERLRGMKVDDMDLYAPRIGGGGGGGGSVAAERPRPAVPPKLHSFAA